MASRTVRRAPCPALSPALVILAAAGALTAGCAFFTTQAFDFAQERWQFCHSRFPSATLEEIRSDGLIRFSDNTGGAEVKDCLKEYAARQSSRVLAPAPPDPEVTP